MGVLVVGLFDVTSVQRLSYGLSSVKRNYTAPCALYALLNAFESNAGWADIDLLVDSIAYEIKDTDDPATTKKISNEFCWID